MSQKRSVIRPVVRARRLADAVEAPGASPVVAARGIADFTKLTLVARAAGRCELRGCNDYLFEHSLTTEPGNFAENAHIVAFSEAGPRGDDPARPVDINRVENLMLLCAACHKLIDSSPLKYPRAELLAHKREHETRIRFLGGLGPEMRTNVLTLKSMIGERVVEIGGDEVAAALRPRYPVSSLHKVIDLSQLGDEMGEHYYPLATRLIRDQVRGMYAQGGAVERVKHLSVFGLAPMPLLVVLGAALSNTVPTDLFQCHRDRPDRWTWYAGEEPTRYAVSRTRNGTDPLRVALVLSLSGTINDADLPLAIDGAFSIYLITLDGVQPNVGCLRQREDLEGFRLAYRALLADVVAGHPGLKAIHLFPAVPAPVAITLGFDLLPKAHPALVVYDMDRRVGGFTERTTVNKNE